MKYWRFLSLPVAALFLLPTTALAATQPGLGSAKKFAVLAGSTITTVPSSAITGDVGLDPGSTVSGFSLISSGTGYFTSTQVVGQVHINDDVARQAKSDLGTAYTAAASAPTTLDLSGQDLGGKTLGPGVYSYSSSAQLTGLLTLSGDAAGVFIFKIAGTLTTASNSLISLADGATACGVYWQVGSANLGSPSHFEGTLMALDSITMGTGASMYGRALALNGAVKLATNTITVPACAEPTTTTLGSSSNPSMVGGSVTYTATVAPTPDGGTVAFTDNATTLASCGVVAVNTSTGKATCTTSYSAVGSHAIHASYSADANYTASSGSLTQQVNAAVLSCPTAASVPATGIAASTSQYTLHNSNGTSWQEIDAAKLTLTCTPSATQSTLLTANADLFTGNAGFNQDLGIFVSDNGGADALLAWKESGGFAGTFSPNAAYVQYLYNMTSGHHYVFKLEWKTNKPASGATIYAGAGNGPYSPTSLVAETFPTGVVPNFAVTTTQHMLSNSDGTTWQPIDLTHLRTTLAPSTNATAVLGANADLFTGKVGYNQDFGIFVSVDGGADALVAWKESGGFAGTFSPNAAFVKATYPMTGTHTYVFTLKWKTNKNALGATIFAGAGSGPYSPTSLVAQSIATGANPYTAVSTNQYHLSNSNGATWQPIAAALNVTVIAGASTNSIVGANADLFTANAGFNQDLGIFVSDNGAPDVLLAWKESGGFAGTFSPNAAYAQTTHQMTSGHTYVFKLKWKTNKNALGATIFAGAGSGPFSPTRLTVELTN
jgi:hypothetical protein